MPADAATCPNEPVRVGRSAALPDCRAYELVTPEHVDSAGGNLDFGRRAEIEAQTEAQAALQARVQAQPPRALRESHTQRRTEKLVRKPVEAGRIFDERP
jgi:hypothetical protein